MCFPWSFFVKKIIHRKFDKIFPCSCDLCGKNFDTMDELIIHMGGHETGDINRRLLNGYGTVRCSKCFQSFETVADMHDHSCTQINSSIRGLSPIQSYDSLDSVVIHS
jgi:hypothetical protein